MPKRIIILVSICMVLIILAGCVFWGNSTDKKEEKLVRISMQIIGALVSGLVSFTGLFITISFQNKQTKDKQLLDILPCFVVLTEENASAIKNINDLSSGDDAIICTTNNRVREQMCAIQNVKSSFAINVSIRDNLDTKDAFVLGSLGGSVQNHQLVLYGDASFFFIHFTDIYGNHYSQKIDYKYSRKINRYLFTLNQPERNESNAEN